MVTPKFLLIVGCGAFTLLSYYALLFTHWGNYFHGGGPVDSALLNAVVVISVYLCLELFRSTTSSLARILSALFGLPLLVIATLSLFYALKFIVSA
jgi:hypothetical protein